MRINCRDAVIALQQIDQKNNSARFLGSAFCYRQNSHYLTAAHCVEDLDPRTIYFYSPADSQLRRMLEIHIHPEADVAMLKTTHRPESKMEKFKHLLHADTFGIDIAAFGYPEDINFDSETTPTPRLFKGHVQRTYMHSSHMGYRYVADELSFPCPPGLSGGPVFAPAFDNAIIGVVTENLEVATSRDSYEEVDEGGGKTVVNNMRITRYGLGVNFTQISDWLTQHSP